MGVFDFLRTDADQDRFASRVMDRMRQRGWPHPLQYDRSRFEIGLGDGGKFLLRSIHREWLKFPRSERALQLDKAIDFLFERDDDQSWDSVRERLLPVVRSRAFFENDGLSAERDWRAGSGWLTRPLTGPLSILLAVDRERGIAMVAESSLQTWGRTFEEALAVARENLRGRSPCRFVKEDGGFHCSDYGDWYDASRILLPHLFRQLPLRGDPVAIVVAREGIVVAGSEEIEALNAMAAFAEESYEDATRRISCAPLVLGEEGWRPFEPEDPRLARLRALWTRQSLEDHAEQTARLEEHFEAIGLDRFVAPLEAVRDGEALRTWTSWTEGAHALLPKADGVCLTDAGGRRLTCAWEKVEAICGPFPTEEGSYPQRYGGEGWPDAQAWARLAAIEPPQWLGSLRA